MLRDYTGVREVVIKPEMLQGIYEGGGQEYDFLSNEYIKFKYDDGNTAYLAKWNSGKCIPLKWKKIDNEYFGTIGPLNEEQRFWFDCLQDESIIGKFCLGKFGVGKTLIGLAWAFSEINNRKSKYQCIHYIRNNVVVRDVGADLGALPKEANDKLKPWAMEMVDVLGSEDMLDLYIEQEKVYLDYLGFCRGRSWENSIIFLEEIQNYTPYHLAVLLSRVGKNSCLIGVGDTRQTDKDVFKKNSGIAKVIEKLSGNPMFGLVTLQKNERSGFSALADLLMED